MASPSFDCENSWPTIAVSRALSASISGAVPGAAGGKPLFGAAAADLSLDGVDHLQALDHFVSEWRLHRLVHLDEFASGVGETKSQLDGAAMTARQRLVGGIAVHLQNAGKACQLSGDLRRAAAVGKHVGNRGRRGAAPWSVIYGMRPELADAGAMSSRIEHRHWRLVAEQARRGLDRPQLQLIEALEPPCGTPRTAGPPPAPARSAASVWATRRCCASPSCVAYRPAWSQPHRRWPAQVI